MKHNPGSDEAIAAGCKCPVLDNAHGRGYLGGVKDERGQTVYVYNFDCPVHAKEKRMKSRKVIVTIELETDAPLETLKNINNWAVYNNQDGDLTNLGTTIEQISVNVAKPVKKEKR